MKSQPSNLIDTPTQEHKNTIHFPKGLPAFENSKDFVLIAQEEEAPFMWLQALDTPNLAFIVADPFTLYSDYSPDVLEEDCETLGIQKPEDAFLVCIVNVRQNETQGITTNLVSPIVINWKTRTAHQVILRNHLDYSVKHPLAVESPND